VRGTRIPRLRFRRAGHGGGDGRHGERGVRGAGAAATAAGHLHAPIPIATGPLQLAGARAGDARRCAFDARTHHALGALRRREATIEGFITRVFGEAREESTTCLGKRRRRTDLGGVTSIRAEQSGSGFRWEGVSCKKIKTAGGKVGGEKHKKTGNRGIKKGWLIL
jgi:hypothetical protein